MTRRRSKLLALLARRREAARLLVLGTYRPVELIVHDHPLKRVKQELAPTGTVRGIPLGGLSPQAVVAAYVAQRFGAPAGHAALAAVVYRRTEGHPLFMVQVVDYLEQQGVAPGRGRGGWAPPGTRRPRLAVPAGAAAADRGAAGAVKRRGPAGAGGRGVWRGRSLPWPVWRPGCRGTRGGGGGV